MGITIGIDLGTTNCCVCYISQSDRIIVPNPEGGRTTPSVVAFAEDSQRLVGALARRQAETNPENTIFAVKRLMGRRFDDPLVQRIGESTPYRIVESEKGDAWVDVRGELYSPPQISSFILRELKRMADEHTGEEITQAVITVPAYFNDAQRQATRDAGRIAGLEVLRIVNEPTAAALAYGIDQSKDMKIAVYDFGGGTFDISILDLSDGMFTVLSTSGDTFLGGEDFDYAIIDWLVNDFEQKEGIDLRDDNIAMQRLKEEAENAKMELSTTDSTEIKLPFIASGDDGPKHLDATLDRKTYEGLVLSLVERSLEPCGTALRDAQVAKKDIDVVLLVGGMTRMPLIRQKVGMWFQKEVDNSVNPDEIVAIGACLQAGIVKGELKDIILMDVTPLTLGLETYGGVFTPVVPKNTTIPYEYTEVFSTTVDNQEMVRIVLGQGERAMSADNKKLAEFELHGIPPAPRGVPKVELKILIDVNGIVSVRATDLGTMREQSMTVMADGGLSEDQIAAMIDEGSTHAEKDKYNKRVTELQNKTRGLIYQTERSLAQYGEYLEDDERLEIREDVETVKELLQDGANADELESIISSLEASAYRLAEAMYSSLNLEESDEAVENESTENTKPKAIADEDIPRMTTGSVVEIVDED